METNHLTNRMGILLALIAITFFPFIIKAQLNVDINNNVGIGTATPGAQLDVRKDIWVGQDYTNPDRGIYFGLNGYQAKIGYNSSTGNLDISPRSSYFTFFTGRVGIGTPIPHNLFDVEGNIAIGANYSGNFYAPTNGAIIEGNVGIGTTSPASKLDVAGGISIGATYSGINPSPLNGAIIQGNVGIGTTAPVARLTVKDAGLGIVNIGQLAGNSLYSGIAFTQTASSLVSGTNYSILGQGSNTYINSPGSGGNIYFRNQNAEQMIILGSSGNVGIGTTAPNYKLEVTGSFNVNGLAYCTNTAWTSDQQFKTNIDSISNALSIINQLKPRTFYFDTTNVYGLNFSNQKQFGLIAQDVQQVLPELVSNTTKTATYDTAGVLLTQAVTYKVLNYNAFTAIMLQGIKEQSGKIDSLSEGLLTEKTKTNKQDSIITSLQNQLNALASTINTCCNENHNNGNHNGEHREANSNQTNVDLNDAQSIVLEQNVPNPFAEQTAINYSLPDNTIKAQMLFYNAQGKLIQSTELTQKGKGTLNVFASDLSNGIYTYTLVVDGKIIETKKMVKQ